MKRNIVTKTLGLRVHAPEVIQSYNNWHMNPDTFTRVNEFKQQLTSTSLQPALNQLNTRVHVFIQAAHSGLSDNNWCHREERSDSTHSQYHRWVPSMSVDLLAPLNPRKTDRRVFMSARACASTTTSTARGARRETAERDRGESSAQGPNAHPFTTESTVYYTRYTRGHVL